MKEIWKPDPLIETLILPRDADEHVVYRPSLYAIPLQYAGKSYVFHTLTKQCIEGTLPRTAKKGEGYDDLIQASFLVPEDEEEWAFYRYVFTLADMAVNQNNGRSYTILPTLACNARCIYCYEAGMKPVTMNEETVQQTIRYILSHDTKHGVALSWFGGEPLLCPEIIDKICYSLKEKGIPYTSKTVTNGSLITPELIAKMNGLWNLSFIQISMDGAESDYIKRKHYYVYDQTYDRVLNNINLLAEAGIDVSVRCNVDEENWQNIPAFLEDFASKIADREHVSIHFALLFDCRRSRNNLAMYQKVMDFDREIQRHGFRIPEPEFAFRRIHCMADAGTEVIGPDGRLYPCEHCPEEACYGDIWNGMTNEAARTEFCRTDEIREECRTCPFLPDCTGFRYCPNQEANCREHRKMILEHQFHLKMERQ